MHPLHLIERKAFYENIHVFFSPNSFKIIVGDFNFIESDLDKFGGNSVISTDLRGLHTIHHLDVWRKNHDRQVQCTWFNSDKTIGTRLDKFFIPQELVDQTVSCEINPCAFLIMMWCNG